jgi:hypothetical protein
MCVDGVLFKAAAGSSKQRSIRRPRECVAVAATSS